MDEVIIKLIIGTIIVFLIWKFFFRERRDKRRAFSESEKKEILKRQDYTCATCSDTDWRLFEAHHKLAWAENGKTNIQNGILLCPKCHRKFSRDYKK